MPGEKYTEKTKTTTETKQNKWGRPEEAEPGEDKKETTVKTERKVENK